MKLDCGNADAMFDCFPTGLDNVMVVPLHSNTTPWVTQCVTWIFLCYECVITFVLSLCNRLM